MEYQKIVSILNDTASQPSEFITRNWVEINDESGEEPLKPTIKLIVKLQ